MQLFYQIHSFQILCIVKKWQTEYDDVQFLKMISEWKNENIQKFVHTKGREINTKYPDLKSWNTIF